jgi:hypothetical protein
MICFIKAHVYGISIAIAAFEYAFLGIMVKDNKMPSLNAIRLPLQYFREQSLECVKLDIGFFNQYFFNSHRCRKNFTGK